MKGSVLVVGSGIAGMRAAAELVGHGLAVHLLERDPTIGGTMARLDKMYPTNECATCTQLPKMLELTSNPNVSILAFAELEEVKEKDGGFAVRITKKVRYVDPMKCNACTECFPVCPVGGVPMAFDFGRGASKAIRFWSPFPPRKALIDPDACTYVKEGTCGDGTEPLCEQACVPGAIDFSQKPTEVTIEVGAIVVAAGAEEEHGETAKRLGHGKVKHVLSSLEYERLLSGLGPTGGTVKRDDGKAPKRVAWVVCEDFDGKQDADGSPIAFMTAVSEALGTLERDSEAEVTVVSGGAKTDGKGYEAFRADAQERGVRLVTAKSVELREGDPLKVVAGEEIAADMVVVACPLAPPAEFDALAGKLGIELDDQRRPVKAGSDPVHTSRDGIFACGTAMGPRGIRESVIEACAAASAAAARLAKVRETETKEPSAPKLLPVAADDEPKIAVVICRCGMNIGGRINLNDLTEHVRSLPNVAAVELTPFGCDGVKMKEMLATGKYNRMVVGACSPRTHEPLFQMCTEQGGLNRYLLEIVNLRNHCTWVHGNDKEGMGRKAKALMAIGVAKAALLDPLEFLRFGVTQSCLVVGATAAGLACAERLGAMGFETHLVAGGKKPGDELAQDTKAYLAPVLESLAKNGNVKVYPASRVRSVSGYVGRYAAEIATDGTAEAIEVGAVVVATRDDMGEKTKQGHYETSLYLTRDDDNVFVGALGNLNPLDTNTDGVFLCGTAREDSDPAAAVASGAAAASRAGAVIGRSELRKEPIISRIIDENCDGCAYCIDPCPSHAITLIEYMSKGQVKKTVQVNEALCKGCGSCMATCPKDGARISNFRPDQFKAMIRAFVEVE